MVLSQSLFANSSPLSLYQLFFATDPTFVESRDACIFGLLIVQREAETHVKNCEKFDLTKKHTLN